MIPAQFEPFLAEAPYCVLTRLTLEALFDPERLDALSRATARRQYEQELLFSQLVELMMSVVLCVHPSVLAAYQKRRAALSVSDQAVYDKLRHTELGVSAALGADAADQAAPTPEALGARRPPWLPGYRARVLDGSHLEATEHRLKETRSTKAAPLPGAVLAVYEPELDLVTRVLLEPDGHAQERSRLDELLAWVQAKDLWIGDRNFCTRKFLLGIDAARAAFLMRQHGQL